MFHVLAHHQRPKFNAWWWWLCGWVEGREEVGGGRERRGRYAACYCQHVAHTPSWSDKSQLWPDTACGPVAARSVQGWRWGWVGAATCLGQCRFRPTCRRRVGPRRVEASKGGGPERANKAGVPKGGEPKNFRAFFPSPTPIFARFVSLWVSSR